MSFRTWLFAQNYRTDPVGHLSREALAARPFRGATPDAIVQGLRGAGADEVTLSKIAPAADEYLHASRLLRRRLARL